jgi:hypothetical protein
MRIWSLTQAPFSLTQKILLQTTHQITTRFKRRAFEIYLELGGLPGRELEDWLQTENEFETAALFMRAVTGEKHRP